MNQPMTAFNGNGKPSPDLLDRALANRPVEVRARVLDLVYRLELDAEDPLFLVMIGFGTLEALLEDSPKKLQQTFEEFLTEVESWSKLHLETLDAIASKAETEEALARTCNELVSSLTRLTTTCNELMLRLPTSPPGYTTSAFNSMASTRDSSGLLEEIWRELSKQGEAQSRSHRQLSRQLSQNGNAVAAVRLWGMVLLSAQIGAAIVLWIMR